MIKGECSDIDIQKGHFAASLAQLEERGSHNPKVVSSILTTRIFLSIQMSSEQRSI